MHCIKLITLQDIDKVFKMILIKMLVTIYQKSLRILVEAIPKVTNLKTFILTLAVSSVATKNIANHQTDEGTSSSAYSYILNANKSTGGQARVQLFYGAFFFVMYNYEYSCAGPTTDYYTVTTRLYNAKFYIGKQLVHYYSLQLHHITTVDITFFLQKREEERSETVIQHCTRDVSLDPCVY